MLNSSGFIEGIKSLYNQGVRKIVTDFSGGGDSGDINYIKFYDGAYPGSSSKELVVEEPLDWRDEMHNIITNEVHCDWYNNDGGGGSIVINLEANPPTIEVNSYWNETVCREEPTVNDTLDPSLVLPKPAAPEHPHAAVRAAKKLPRRRAK
jgi:hypothetical protein